MEQIMPYLEQLATKMGVAVTHLWEVLIKQSIVNGISNLIWGISFLVLMVFLVLTLKPILKFISDKYNYLKNDRLNNSTGYNGCRNVSSMEEDFWCGMKNTYLMLVSICLIIFLFVSLGNITSGIKRIVNPEYYAIQQVLDVIK